MKDRHHCHVEDCTKTCAPSRGFCSRHWKALPDEVKAGLRSYWKQYRKWTPSIVAIAIEALK